MCSATPAGSATSLSYLINELSPIRQHMRRPIGVPRVLQANTPDIYLRLCPCSPSPCFILDRILLFTTYFSTNGIYSPL